MKNRLEEKKDGLSVIVSSSAFLFTCANANILLVIEQQLLKVSCACREHRDGHGEKNVDLHENESLSLLVKVCVFLFRLRLRAHNKHNLLQKHVTPTSQVSSFTVQQLKANYSPHQHRCIAGKPAAYTTHAFCQ